MYISRCRKWSAAMMSLKQKWTVKEYINTMSRVCVVLLYWVDIGAVKVKKKDTKSVVVSGGQ